MSTPYDRQPHRYGANLRTAHSTAAGGPLHCAGTRHRSGLGTRYRRQRHARLVHALLASLIHADHRIRRIIRTGIHRKDFLHRTDERGVLLGCVAPHLLAPPLELVFFQHPAHRLVRYRLHHLASLQLTRQQPVASSARIRPADHYRRWRPTAPRPRHQAPMTGPGSACGDPERLPNLPAHSALAESLHRPSPNADGLCDFMIKLAWLVLSLVGQQQNLGMTPTVGRHLAGVDQYSEILPVPQRSNGSRRASSPSPLPVRL